VNAPAPMRILLEDGEGRQRAVALEDGEILVGRAPGSAVVLEDRNVSRRHARFLRQNGAVYLEDLGSANGTRVNGERIGGKRRIRPGDLVQIGDWDLALEGPTPPEGAAERPRAAERPAPAGEPRSAAPRGAGLRLGWRPAVALVLVWVLATLAGYLAGRGVKKAPEPPAASDRTHLP